ncbi:hypothetical protein [Natrarchaeobaculum aegyptiacum]|uniref:Uncharacterized protein n=1 Tax=Natrarchaeobaculum aegyptiacum TaxID=745377 RepID=A0A2Z2HV01_9EURY|nr:hypothetical protein [Natrarchaeobaculum aegyptiacum]ARS91099.1 hypothetical protein B1756_16075 [Natrarchaeobaculum aegyptiacum]
MGIFDLMLGRTEHGEQGVEGRSYKLPKETHDFVHPVAIRREELDALSQLLDADVEASAPAADPDELQAVLDSAFDDVDLDASELTDRTEKPRAKTAAITETWTDQLEAEIGVVYARMGTYPTVRSFVTICKRRANDADDPFELPESFPHVATLLGRLEDATDDQYRAVVHTDLLPDR